MQQSSLYLIQWSCCCRYVAVCFADRIAGVWQGGSGLALSGYQPIPPGIQGQCSYDDYANDGASCCSTDTNHFCTDCQYWPIYPKSCGNTLIDCLVSYEDDPVGCGSDYYMYNAMQNEGHDPRLMSIKNDDRLLISSGSGHQPPQNEWAWKAGCLGLTDPCSSACEAAFVACTNSISSNPNSNMNLLGPQIYAQCESLLANGILTECTPGCSPTIGMLLTSEDAVISLSNGNFGNNSNPIAADTNLYVGNAEPPVCDPVKTDGYGSYLTEGSDISNETDDGTECAWPTSSVETYNDPLPFPDSSCQ